MYKLFKRIFFIFPPEFIHDFVFILLKLFNYIPFYNYFIRRSFTVNNINLNREVFGINFKNPVGLAAGFDKNAYLFKELSNYGFGFIEIGTVTPKPQSGNPKPRLFRLTADNALINRMGFNNDGVLSIVNRLKKRNSDIIIGGNIGKNKITPNDLAFKDYEICFEELFPYVDYFVVNVSSPNTPGLRELQEKEPLLKLLIHLQNLNNKKNNKKPILLKIAPDLSNEQLNDIIFIVKESKINGIIATNTTIDRSNLKSDCKNIGSGGLSGKPLNSRSTDVIRYISQKSKKTIPIIGVGGIHSSFDALEKLEAGACLVQLYTGFIYEGPSLVKKINQEILKKYENN